MLTLSPAKSRIFSAPQWIEHRDSNSTNEATGTATPFAVVSGVNTNTPALYRVMWDSRNRPILMSDMNRQAVWRAQYLPFGGVHQIEGSASLNARFPGQWYQLESGLAYNWHRHYDATLGSYTQPDPLGLVDGPNRYSYALNAPNMYVDPRGENLLLLRRLVGQLFKRGIPPLKPLKPETVLSICKKTSRNNYQYPGKGGYDEALRVFRSLTKRKSIRPSADGRVLQGIGADGKTVSLRRFNTKGPGNQRLPKGEPGRPTIEVSKDIKIRF